MNGHDSVGDPREITIYLIFGKEKVMIINECKYVHK